MESRSVLTKPWLIDTVAELRVVLSASNTCSCGSRMLAPPMNAAVTWLTDNWTAGVANANGTSECESCPPGDAIYTLLLSELTSTEKALVIPVVVLLYVSDPVSRSR